MGGGGRSPSYDLYDLTDILGWEHQWVDKTQTNRNMMGTLNSTTARAKSVLVLKSNNPHKPLYKVSMLSHAQGEAWMARLGAMING